LDIAIAGMGMGGLCLACLLAEQGHRVVLYDQMERPGPVGSGFVLQPTGLAVLERLGLRQTTEARGQRIDTMLGKLSRNGKVVLDVGYRKGEYGIAIIRWALFDILYQRASSFGVGIETSRPVRAVENGARTRIVFDNGIKSPDFDLVVDAMGAHSPLREVMGRELAYGALWVNLPWQEGIGFERNRLEQRYHRASTMIGVLPLGQARDDMPAMTTFFWSLRHRDVAKWRQDGIAAWVDSICQYWPQVAPFLDNIEAHQDSIVHANYRHHTHLNPVSNRLVRLGDAWHATSPQLGQGANMAFLDALALSQALKQHRDLAHALKDYTARRRAHLLFYQGLSDCLTPFYQSDNRILPAVRDWLIAPAMRRRGLVFKMAAAMVTGQMLNPVKRILR